ncbi:cupin domain-containing protein [Deinococcus oregonensis]|uniref:Cupin domain-containing protein n=1 Tax=Deinococcus oregonensis TaxID=1805970 RepID=A0ABV6B579_9DEIO
MTTHTKNAPKTLHMFGSRITLHRMGEDTGASAPCWNTAARPSSPVHPPHIHDTFVKVFHVLSGRLTFSLGGKTLMAGVRDTVRIPQGVPHTFSNPEQERTRFLILNTPGGFEQYFVELAALISARPERGSRPHPRPGAPWRKSYAEEHDRPLAPVRCPRRLQHPFGREPPSPAPRPDLSHRNADRRGSTYDRRAPGRLRHLGGWQAQR